MIQKDLELLKTLKILYVEDDPDISKFMMEILDKISMKTTAAANGKEALEAFKKDEPDLVITDLRMPEMTGMELSAEIKKINEKTPVIILSAHNESEYIENALSLGLDRYLIKPVDVDKLIEAIIHIVKNL